MYYRYTSTNPVIQIVAIILAVMLLGLILTLGAFIMAGVFGLAVVGGLIFYVRLWWARRKLRSGRNSTARAAGRVIEGEYFIEQGDNTTRRRGR